MSLPWYSLIHQLPPEPLYLRAKIRRRLARAGAMPLKNAVYVLPRRDECLEDFRRIASEAIAGGGEAYVCEAEFLESRTDTVLVEQFRSARDADYETLARTIRDWSRSGRRGSLAPQEEDLLALTARVRKRFDEIATIDFLQARQRSKPESL